jgi:hypothetical protein
LTSAASTWNCRRPPPRPSNDPHIGQLPVPSWSTTAVGCCCCGGTVSAPTPGATRSRWAPSAPVRPRSRRPPARWRTSPAGDPAR